MWILPRAAVLAILVAAVLPATAVAEPLPYASMTPADGAVKLTTAGALQITVESPRRGMLLWAEVSRSSLLGVDGTLALDFAEEMAIPLTESDAFPGTYRGTSYDIDEGYWWTSRPGTYYWQVWGAGGTTTGWRGPVRTLTVKAPPPPPPPAPRPSPAPANPYAGLVSTDIPLWVSPRRRSGGFVSSTANIPSSVSPARWLALTRTTADRWNLLNRGSVSGPVKNGDYTNQFGFGALDRATLGETVTTSVRTYRRVRVCRRVRTRAGRRVKRCGKQRRYVGQRVVDRDITLNSIVPWQAGPTYPSVSQYDLQSVLIHEMGHFAGNGHRSYCQNTPMVESFDTGEWWRSEADSRWFGCGTASTARARATRRGRLHERNLYVDVPVGATAAEIRQAINETLQRPKT